MSEICLVIQASLPSVPFLPAWFCDHPLWLLQGPGQFCSPGGSFIWEVEIPTATLAQSRSAAPYRRALSPKYICQPQVPYSFGFSGTAQCCSLWEPKGCSGPVTASTEGLVWVWGLMGEQMGCGDGEGTGCRHFCAEGTACSCHAAGALRNGVRGLGVQSLSLRTELCYFLHSGKNRCLS